YRQSPEESTTPGISLTDSIAFTQKLTQLPVDYLHLSLKDATQTSFRDKKDTTPIVSRYRQALPDQYPIMVAGLLKQPGQVEALMDLGATFAALGRQLIIDPNWVEKIVANDEKSIRYALSPSEFETLAIPKPLENWLLTRFRNGLPLTTDPEFNPERPWQYYKHDTLSDRKPIDPTKLMTLKPKK
ncbi:MAG: NADH-dependent flavin oxidoreductase, partial [Leuconostoc citreum]